VQVRGGEKASLVVFYKEFSAEPNPDDGADDGIRRVARASYVFNAAQTENYSAPAMPEPLGPIERIEAADQFLKNTGARIEVGGSRPSRTRPAHRPFGTDPGTPRPG
jgi:antirestriction protein ArdC